MAQDGPHGNQGTTASDDHGSASPATVTTTQSPAKNSNGGSSWTGIPLAKDAIKGKDEVVPNAQGKEPGWASGSRTGAGRSKRKRSAAAIAAADVTNDDISRGKGKAAADEATSAGDTAPHIINERQRRKRMKDKFTDLQALLPDVPEKTDKATIVAEAIKFVRVLESTVADLEKLKHDRRALAQQATGAKSSSAPPEVAKGAAVPRVLPQGWDWLPKKQKQQPAAGADPPLVVFKTWSEANVMLNVWNDDAFITVCAPPRAGILPLVLSILDAHRIDFVTAEVASDAARSIFNIHTCVNAAAIQQLGSEAPASEDIYKLAVSEIMVWLSS